MLVIQPEQFGGLQEDAKRAFVRKLRRELQAHPVTGPIVRGRPLDWYEWAVEGALYYGIDIEIDVAEFAAQLIVHGDDVLARDDVRAILGPTDRPGWLKLLQFARARFIIERPQV